ncbi:hypothetical protein IFR05_012690 [Cadophora sp. M221]|nr:hypothetical protein IFR05_012690 [Cadophora sp. M221]
MVMSSYPILPNQLPATNIEFVNVPSEDPDFYLANQPIYCSMETLYVLMDRNELGINLANKSSALATMAHLYNALPLKDILKERWIEMDGFIGRNMSSSYVWEFQLASLLQILLELLALFKHHCQEAITGFEADIISLTRKSADLLQRIRAALKGTHYLGQEHHKDHGEMHEMCRQCNIELAFRLLLNNDQDKMLKAAGEVVTGFLPEANAIVEVAPLDPVAETRI